MSRGWKFVLLKGKRPLKPSWQSLPATAEEIESWLDQGENIGILTGEPSGVVILDVDTEKGGALPEAIPETVTVQTGGGGVHYYFRMPEGCAVRNSVGKIAPHVDMRSTGGQAVFPGSVHPETGNVYCWVISPEDMEPAPLPDWLLEPPKEPSAPALPPPDLETRHLGGYAKSALQNEYNYVFRAVPGERNDKLNRAAYNLGQLVGAGLLARDEVERALTQAATHAGLLQDEIDATMASGLNSGIKTPRAVKQKVTLNSPISAPAQRPAVLIPGTHVDEEGLYHTVGNGDCADEVLTAIAEGAMYRRGGLVGVVEGRGGEAIWRELSPEEAQSVIDDNCMLIQKKQTDDGVAEIFHPCARGLANVILGRARQSHLVPDIRRIVHYPVLLPNRTWAKRGMNYDGTYYDEPADLEGIQPESDVEDFHEWFDDLLVDFPFADTASKHNFVSLLLTPIIGLGGNRPIFLIGATLPRTGKSKLAEEVVGGLLLGRSTPALQLTGREEEREKRITALLLRGTNIVHLDNLDKQLSSPTLASLATASVFQSRLLGASHIVEMPNSLTVVATGNNVDCSQEIVKRIVPILLQPPSSAPELRTAFRHPDLREHIRANRRQLMSYLLGIVEHWLDPVADEGVVWPDPPAFGGFETWSNTVGCAMMKGGFRHFLRNRERYQRTHDSGSNEWLLLVDEWASRHASRKLVIQDVLNLCRDMELIQEVIQHEPAQNHRAKVALAAKLREMRDAPIGSWVLRITDGAPRRYYLDPTDQLPF